MIRTSFLAVVLLLAAPAVHAQDVRGIELCTQESRMDRRTSCLQSNVEYLQQLIGKTNAGLQQRLSAANNEIAALKTALAALQARVEKLQAAAEKAAPAGKPENADKAAK